MHRFRTLAVGVACLFSMLGADAPVDSKLVFFPRTLASSQTIVSPSTSDAQCPMEMQSLVQPLRDGVTKVVRDATSQRMGTAFPKALPNFRSPEGDTVKYRGEGDHFVLIIAPKDDSNVELAAILTCTHIFVGPRERADSLGLYTSGGDGHFYYDSRLGWYITQPGMGN
jgi:hypothetical protein